MKELTKHVYTGFMKKDIYFVFSVLIGFYFFFIIAEFVKLMKCEGLMTTKFFSFKVRAKLLALLVESRFFSVLVRPSHDNFVKIRTIQTVK